MVAGERVALLGAVQRDGGDVAVDRQQDLLERRKFSQPRNRMPAAAPARG